MLPGEELGAEGSLSLRVLVRVEEEEDGLEPPVSLGDELELALVVVTVSRPPPLLELDEVGVLELLELLGLLELSGLLLLGLLLDALELVDVTVSKPPPPLVEALEDEPVLDEDDGGG